MEWFHILLILVAGFGAGVINTLAGSGSVVTISLFVFLGLDPQTANGTNRIGVLVQSIVGAKTFTSGEKLPGDMWLWQIVPSVIGAVAGSYVASILDTETMGTAIGWLFVLLFILILVKPSSWLRTVSQPKDNHRSPLSIAMFLAIGFYGGFIQAGVGIFLLSALVLYAGYNLNAANAIKLIAISIFTVPALIVFILQGQVNWMYGLLMAVGQSVGGYVAARFAMHHEKANIWVRRLLIVIVAVSIVKFLELYKLIGL